jgi:predicted HTH domain antitoxin
MNISIPDDSISKANISPEQLRIEIACFLYDKKIFSMGQARRFAETDAITFQRELAKNNYYIHFSIDDLKKDIDNIN